MKLIVSPFWAVVIAHRNVPADPSSAVLVTVQVDARMGLATAMSTADNKMIAWNGLRGMPASGLLTCI